MNLITEKKIKAPKTYKRQEQFIEELLQTPEYQDKIQKLAWESTERQRKYTEEDLERDRKLLSIANPESEEFVEQLIKWSKGSICYSKEQICGLDISRIFEMYKDKKRYPETFDERSVLQVIAQIPPEEYLEKIRPKLIRSVESVLKEYSHDSKVLLAKQVGVSVAAFATYFAGSSVLGALGTTPGVMIANSANSEAAMTTGAVLAVLGGVAGIAGGIKGALALGKKAEKIEDARWDVRYEDYIRKEIEKILTEAGYMEKQGSEAAAQPGEE